MANVKVRLLKTTRIDGEHTEAGTVVELEGRSPKGELYGDARYMVTRGFAEEIGADAGKAEGAGKRKGGD